jgi:hypothetical protein
MAAPGLSQAFTLLTFLMGQRAFREIGYDVKKWPK